MWLFKEAAQLYSYREAAICSPDGSAPCGGGGRRPGFQSPVAGFSLYTCKLGITFVPSPDSKTLCKI